MYEFKYKDVRDGKGTYQGVIADDLPKNVYNEAVSKDENGNEVVDYSKLNIEFKRIK